MMMMGQTSSLVNIPCVNESLDPACEIYTDVIRGSLQT